MKINYLLISLYLLTGLIPYFGSIDKVYTQSLYLSCLNFSIFSYLYIKYKGDFLRQIGKLFMVKPVIFLSLFFIWSLVTAFFAINISESFKILTEFFHQLIALIILIFLLSKVQNIEKLLIYIIPILCLAELISVYIPYISDIYADGIPQSRVLKYRGFAGNINIMAYFLLFKIPFMLYFIFRKTNVYLNSFLIIGSLYAIFSILETRSAVLTLIFIFLAFFSYLLVFNRKDIIKIKVLSRLMIPVFISIFLSNILSNYFQTRTVQDRVASLAQIAEDESLNQRLRYYSAALNSIQENPIFGVGIGNWEIESIKYEGKYMRSYVVPYHAHNDYLETAAETGIPGVILYYTPILLIVFLLFKKAIEKNPKRENNFIYFIILLSISTYLIDALFNFPFARVVSQIYLMFFLAVSINILQIKNTNNLEFSKLPILIVLLLMPLSIYSSVKLYQSSEDQRILLVQFNKQDYSYPDLEVLDKMEMDYTSLSATTIPMYTFKGLYYQDQGKHEQAIEFFRKGIKVNPYMYISESFMGRSFFFLKELDSAEYYTKKAFKNLPNNLPHYANYLQVLKTKGDSIAIKEAYNQVTLKDSRGIHEEFYLLAMSDVVKPGESNYVLEDLEDINIETGTDLLKKGYYSIKLGDEKVYEADYLYQLGVISFENKLFEEALDYFKRASILNPLELPYKENVANSLMQLGRDLESLEVLNQLIDVDKTKSLKAYFLRSLIYYGLDETTKACIDLKYLNDLKYLGQNNLYTTLCGS